MFAACSVEHGTGSWEKVWQCRPAHSAVSARPARLGGGSAALPRYCRQKRGGAVPAYSAAVGGAVDPCIFVVVKWSGGRCFLAIKKRGSSVDSVSGAYYSDPYHTRPSESLGSNQYAASAYALHFNARPAGVTDQQSAAPLLAALTARVTIMSDRSAYSPQKAQYFRAVAK